MPRAGFTFAAALLSIRHSHAKSETTDTQNALATTRHPRRFCDDLDARGLHKALPIRLANRVWQEHLANY
jgi:hypothetical protein